MKKILEIILLLVIVVLLSSCAMYKTTFTTKSVAKLENVAIISEFIQFSPPTAGLYAATMNGKINSIVEELHILFQDYATYYRDSLGMYISSNYKCNVLYGNVLQSDPEFVKLKDAYYTPDGLATGNKSFPNKFLSSGDIYSKALYLSSDKIDSSSLSQQKKTAQELCKDLKVDFILVSATSLVATEGNAYIKGGIDPLTSMILFDKDGDKIAAGTKIGGGDIINASKIEEYPKILNNHLKVIKLLASDIFNKYALR